jgi:integrase
MPYKKAYVPSKKAYFYKFRIKQSSCYPPEIKDTIPDIGQTENELKLHEADLIKKLKERSAEYRKKSNRITFNDYINCYWEITTDHSHPTIISDIREAVGSIEIKDGDFIDVETKFNKFLKDQEGRKVKRWKVDSESGELVLKDTDKTLSESALQGYRRYFRAICNNGRRIPLSYGLPRITEANDPSSSIVVGKPEERCRPPEDWEREKIFEFLEDPKYSEYHFMKSVIDFARCNPIRPSDQIELQVSRIDEINKQIPYIPGKTKKTGKEATPIIFPVVKEFILGRIHDTECPTVFYWIENGKKRSISYWKLNSAWNYIKEKCGITNFEFYDWRHDAVNLLFSLGYNNRQIMQIAGWSSENMLSTYNNRDRARLHKATSEILENGHKTIVKEVS